LNALLVFSHLVNYVQDEIPEVRQAAAYGVGVMAVHAKETIHI